MESRTAQLLLAAAVIATLSFVATSEQITLQNKLGFMVVLTPTGATIQKLLVPTCKDKRRVVDVALGYDNVMGYAMDPHPNFGATVGRVANRISNAQFTLGCQNFTVEANDGTSCIHGCAVPWAKMTWQGTASPDGLSATYTYTSVDGEAGFPGTVLAKVVYSIPAAGTSLSISMTATTDKPTPLSVINHNYFNLKGAGKGDVLDHFVQLNAQYYTPAREGQLIPTGQVAVVKGTAYDFTTLKPIRQDLKRANGGPYRGYDTNFVLPPTADTVKQEPVWWMPNANPQVAADQATRTLTLAATVIEPTTAIRLRVYTNAPGMQFYTGNFLDGKQPVPGKGGVYYQQHSGFCVEAQAFPNAINTPTFPSMVVQRGQTFNNRVTYDFGCK